MRALSEVLNKVLLGDCLELLRELPDASVDACVTDPPYGLGTHEPTAEEIDAYLSGGRLDVGGDFMSTDWDMPSVPTWKEILRVVKPGGYVLAFAGTRTWDIMDIGMRAAGLTDEETFARKFGPSMLQWVQGQGFPKSHNISKAIDKLLGAERQVVGMKRGKGGDNGNIAARPNGNDDPDAKGCGAYSVGTKQTDIDIPVTSSATDLAKKWEGYGTALKPSWEPILVFQRKPEPLKGQPAFIFPQIDVPFFYTGKATKSETSLKNEMDAIDEVDNVHPTRKPLALMRWLLKLAVPPGGIVLDPYSGSGSTLHAAAEERMQFIGMEKHPPFHEIATKRMAIVMARTERQQAQTGLFDMMGDLAQE